MIPLSRPWINDDEINSVVEVLKNGWFAHGPKNNEFERLFANYVGVNEAISVNSCASALQLAILALGIKGEVILPSFTFVASANAIVTAGAIPVFVDVSYDTCNIQPEAIEAAVTPRTEAIMVVHFGGQCADMEKIMKIAAKHKLAVIEDSAETLGGTHFGRQAGSIGIVGCFSFFPTKNLTTGEGGMVTTSDQEISAKIRALMGHGIAKTTLAREKEKRPWLRAATTAGYNYRMSNILAAIGVEQIKKLDQMNEIRRKRADQLTEVLKDCSLVKPPQERDCNKHVYQMYTVKVPSNVRDELVIRLHNSGIQASVHFDPPVHSQPYYKDSFKVHDMKNTNKLSREIVTLPMFSGISEKEIQLVGETCIRELKGLM